MVAPVQKSAMEIPQSCTNPSIWCRQIQVSTRHVAATWPGIILCMPSANERWRYTVTLFLIGWAHTQNHPCMAPGHMPWLFDQESLLVKARILSDILVSYKLYYLGGFPSSLRRPSVCIWTLIRSVGLAINCAKPPAVIPPTTAFLERRGSGYMLPSHCI